MNTFKKKAKALFSKGAITTDDLAELFQEIYDAGYDEGFLRGKLGK